MVGMEGGRELGSQARRAVEALARNGIMRARDFGEAGVDRETLRRLEGAGLVVRIAHGTYRLKDSGSNDWEALAGASARIRVPHFFWLTTASEFHGLTHLGPMAGPSIHVAVEKGRSAPDFGTVKAARLTGAAWTVGIEEVEAGGVRVRMTDRARTVVDLFRLRDKVGRETARSALRGYLDAGLPRRKLAEYARAFDIGLAEKVADELDASEMFGPR